MPTYEYSCEKCGKTFETVQSMRDEPLRECSKELCRQKKWGHGKVKRLIGTGAGLLFKGSGFYITDYSKNTSARPQLLDPGVGEPRRRAGQHDRFVLFAAPAASAEKAAATASSTGSPAPSTAPKSAEAKPKKQSTE